MAFTYSATPLTNSRDEVRDLMSDTQEATHLVSDEFIVYALSKGSNNVNKACAIICDMLAVRFSKDADVRVSTYATDRRSVSDKYRMMAKQFRSKSLGGGAFLMPALKHSSKNNSTEDADIVQPSFKRGMHEFNSDDTVDELAVE